MDIRLISLAFNIFVWVSGIVAFCILKFNDFKHIEDDVKKLEVKVDELEKHQNKRHEENLQTIGKIASDVSYLRGIQTNK